MSGDGEVHGLSAAVGELRADVRNLAEAMGQVSTDVGQLSTVVARLEQTVTGIKPEVDAYRTERDQRAGVVIWRGRMWNMAIAIGTAIGSGAGAIQALRWLWAKG